jgi:hypothetical protein
MSYHRVVRFLSQAVLVVLLAGMVAACKKNPVNPDDDHADAEGLVLRMNGVDIVTVKEGQVSGSISVKVGEETDHIAVYFLDDHNDRFQPTGKDYSLGWALGDETVAGVYRDPGEEWEIHIVGKKVGQTTIEIRLLHVGHVDFRTPPIPINVTP